MTQTSHTLNSYASDRPHRVRGYYMRVQRRGPGAMSDYQHAWARVPDLPSEWETLKADPTISYAELFLATQRKKPAHKRKLLDSFVR